MGTWDVDIFDNDTASDVHIRFEEILKEGYSLEIATSQTLKDFADYIEDVEDKPRVYLALAAIQVQHNFLQPRIKKMALKLIEDELTEPQEWFDESCIDKRRIVLEEFKSKLHETNAVSKWKLM